MISVILYKRIPGEKMAVQDRVFKTVQDAKKAKDEHGERVINATLGSLYDETPELVAYQSFYDVYQSLSRKELAAYASHLQGTPDYRAAIQEWLGVPDAEVIATPGATGALSIVIHEALPVASTIILPSIYWGPYELMAQFQDHSIRKYDMFQGDSFHIKSFQEVTTRVMQELGHMTVMINDPAQNPTGYSMSDEEWLAVMKHLRLLSTTGEVNVILDIAYIDYTKRADRRRGMFRFFRDLPDRLNIFVCASLSKTATVYGMRLGALVIFSQQKEQLAETYSAAARSVWSNVNNGGQIAFSRLIKTPALKQAFYAEQQEYIDMLNTRSELFLQEAKAVGLPIYPHTEGFFVTIPLAVEYRDQVDQALRNELVYTISLAGGVRVALCAIPLRQVKGLAATIHRVIQQVTSV
jgi:aspartate aminotransferase/aromatic-amino-acid transaminase